jgi:SH3-like domain-containing protein
MFAHVSYGRLILPLVAGGLAIALLLPGGETQTNVAASVAPARVNGPNAEPIAVARVGTATLTPIPMSQLAPQVAAAPAVPNAATATPAPPPVQATASVPEAPAAVPKSGEPGTVGGRAVNLRVGPSKSTASLAVLQPGEPVQELEQSEGWTYVATLSGDTGWISSSFLGGAAQPAKAATTKREENSAKGETGSPNGGKAIRASGPVTVRSSPSSMSERLFVIEAGEPMRIAETRGNWARVVLGNGISGWVRIRRAD